MVGVIGRMRCGDLGKISLKTASAFFYPKGCDEGVSCAFQKA